MKITSYSPGKFDINKQIEKTTNIKYLKDLLKYIDMDIENIGKCSHAIKEMKAKMMHISIEDMEKQQLDYFINLKAKIENKILNLNYDNERRKNK